MVEAAQARLRNQRAMRGRHGEHVEGNDRLTVVVKKSQPFLGRITPASDSP